MRLGDFIRSNLEAILIEWDAFARSLLPGGKMDALALRDHAREILLASVRDMATAQSRQEQSTKSTGHGADSAHSLELDGASGHHAIGRVEAGFDLMELVSEYRALRASVIRLWQESLPAPDHQDLEELTRFNESMDQSLAMAVQSYTQRVEQTRNTFLAFLSHDLRTPLASVHMGARSLCHLVKEPKAKEIANIVLRSASAMNGMIGDLLQFASSSLGTRIPLELAETDLSAVCREVIEETRGANPNCTLRFRGDAPVYGSWDRARLREVVSNLVSNAVKHGSGDESPITLTLGCDADEARLTVHNHGEPIPENLLPTIFQPMVRGSHKSPRKTPDGSLGLGLAIVDRVVSAHGGRVEVRSTHDAGTTFTVHLPRKQ